MNLLYYKLVANAARLLTPPVGKTIKIEATLGLFQGTIQVFAWYNWENEINFQ